MKAKEFRELSSEIHSRGEMLKTHIYTIALALLVQESKWGAKQIKQIASSEKWYITELLNNVILRKDNEDIDVF